MEPVSSKIAKMKIKSTESGKRAFSGLEKILNEANKNYVTSCDKRRLYQTRIQVEQIITKLVAAMKTQSSTFSKLYVKNFGVGSVYEKTKIGEPNEFDIDIVLKMPELVKPVLLEKEFAGFVQVQLENFENLDKTDDMYTTLKEFVDDQNYILSQEMMLLFIDRILRKALNKIFPNGIIPINQKEYKISKIEHIEPALTLTIQGPDLLLSVDLVASFLLNGEFWPRINFREIPCLSQKEFFLTPARPVEDHLHKQRFWRPSFHVQERQIMFNRQWMKPAFRILKKVRDHFKQNVYSYAIKTLFLWELYSGNPDLDTKTPPFWKSSLGSVVVHMLEKYLKYLEGRKIPYFWNNQLNLLSYLPEKEMEQYQSDITEILNDIRESKLEVLAKYFK